MKTLTALILLLALVMLLATPFAGAQQPPPATPVPDVIVIPPPSDPVDDILNNPAVLTPRPTATFPNIPPPGELRPGITAIVIDEPLNVRDIPSVQGSDVLLQLNRGDDVTVLSLTPDRQWALVDTRGPDFITGWVNTDFIRQQSDFMPFQATSVPGEPGTGLILRAQVNVNVRAAPVLFSPRVGILAAGVEAEIIGRKSTYEWWKIRLNDGTVGWVSSVYVYIASQEAYQLAPVLVE